MEAKIAHEAELNDLEVFVSQSGNDHAGSPMRNYIKQRREELGIAFAPKVALSPDAQARVEEIDALEGWMNRHGIGNDNPDNPMRVYVRQRRSALLEPPKASAPVVPGQVPPVAPKAPVPAGAIAPVPSFSPAAGKVPSGQLITLSDSLVGSAIHYTLDGSGPSVGSPSTKLYTAPFAISGPVTVKAMATANGYANSQVVSAAYSL